MTRVAVDAMGGDKAPSEIVRGAILAASIGCEVALVGPPDVIRREIAAAGAPATFQPRIVEAHDVVAMDDSPSTVLRRKKESSLAIAIDLVKRGEADAAVSAGNSGAMMALALMTLGRISGIERPAIATVFPVPGGRETVLLDAGANVDCSSENLVQFAQMGSVYSQCVHRIKNPRVAVLSIGEEDTKGNTLTKETASLLRGMPMQFIGNVEGRHLFSGESDVIVCDGFVGNVALKVAEGTAEMLQGILKNEFGRTPWRKITGHLARPVFLALKRRTDYDAYGGAPLLGVNGVCIISHGRSNARAIFNAIRQADDSVKHGVVDRIRKAVQAPVPAG